MKASELAAVLGGTLEGDDVEIVACAGLDEARKGDWCTVPRPSPVRPGDRVYAVVLRRG